MIAFLVGVLSGVAIRAAVDWLRRARVRAEIAAMQAIGEAATRRARSGR